MLVNCAAYQDGKKLADIPVSQIHLFVNEPGCFVWVALKDPEQTELETMQKEFGLHELAVEDAMKGHQRPKIEEYGPSLFLVMHMVENGGEELCVGEVCIFVGKNYVLSVRHRARQGFTDVRKRCETEPELLSHGSAYVLSALMDAVEDRYFPVLDAIETELEQVEEKIFARQTERASIEALYVIKQKLMTLTHAAEPLLEAGSRLYGGRVPPLCLPLQ
ncbi:MAG TPA: CorA family divalent cation transporter, partial [Candidatus Limnocylindria bacterium]|nr:CorA family divalent cation transporter [Candidatus Limnocylindria bacterium]